MDNQKIYYFSWVRKGLGCRLTEVDTLGDLPEDSSSLTKNRSTLSLTTSYNITKPLQEGQQEPATEIRDFEKVLQMTGPGDIKGVSASAIIKKVPSGTGAPMAVSYFPYVEFWEPDFLWRYTPAAVNEDRLRPWLALVVCEKSKCSVASGKQCGTAEFSFLNEEDYNSVFFPAEELWKTAHAQGLTADCPGLCRLIGIRRQGIDLKKDAAYVAMLIPSFETGRITGIGGKTPLDGITAQAPSWEATLEAQMAKESGLKFPVYYSWEFTTGDDSFDDLVRDIQIVDAKGGSINVDVTQMGEGLDYKIFESYPDRKSISLPTATKAYDAEEEKAFPHPNNKEEKQIYQNMTTLLQENPVFLENMAEIGKIDAAQAEGDDDPLIVPPVYGAKHIMAEKIDSEKWLDQINRDVHYRAVAGLGKKTIQINQESFMDRAWKQVELVNALNHELYQRLLSYRANQALQKKVGKMAEGLNPKDPKYNEKYLSILMQYLSSMKDVKSNGGNTLGGLLGKSGIPESFASATFSELTRRMAERNKDIDLASVMDNIVEDHIFESKEYVVPDTWKAEYAKNVFSTEMLNKIFDEGLGGYVKIVDGKLGRKDLSELKVTRDKLHFGHKDLEGKIYQPEPEGYDKHCNFLKNNFNTLSETDRNEISFIIDIFSWGPTKSRNGNTMYQSNIDAINLRIYELAIAITESRRIPSKYLYYYYFVTQAIAQKKCKDIFDAMELFIKQGKNKVYTIGYSGKLEDLLVISANSSMGSGKLHRRAKNYGSTSGICYGGSMYSVVAIDDEAYDNLFGTEKLITQMGYLYYVPLNRFLKESKAYKDKVYACNYYPSSKGNLEEQEYEGEGNNANFLKFERINEVDTITISGNHRLPQLNVSNDPIISAKVKTEEFSIPRQIIMFPDDCSGYGATLNFGFDMENQYLGYNLTREEVKRRTALIYQIDKYLFEYPDQIFIDIEALPQEWMQTFQTKDEYLSFVRKEKDKYPGMSKMFNDWFLLQDYMVQFESEATTSKVSNSDIKDMQESIVDNSGFEAMKEVCSGYFTVFLEDSPEGKKLRDRYIEELLLTKYPILAYPQFAEPTYYYLKQFSEKFILPGIDEQPDDSIAMCCSNPKFIESFLCGMNTEMGREMLWREYPTDQRGSYFRKFWDSETDRNSILEDSFFDIAPMHTWTGKLGENQNKTGLVIFTIKGRIMKFFPDTQVYLKKSKLDLAKKAIVIDPNGDMIKPVLHAYLRDDVYAVGFKAELMDLIGNPEKNDYGYCLAFEEDVEDLNFQYENTSQLETSAKVAFKLINDPTVYGKHISLFVKA